MSKVSIVRCKDYDKGLVEDAVARSMELIGGIGSVVKSGDKVMLKVNITDMMPVDKAVTTHPAVVRAVLKLLNDSGAKVSIGESCGSTRWDAADEMRKKAKAKLFKKDFESAKLFFRTLYMIENIKDMLDFRLPGEDKPMFDKSEIDFTKHFQEAFSSVGIKEVADEFGVPTVSFDDEEWVEQPNPDGVFLKKIWLSRTTLEADVIIDLPKLKTHELVLYTGAVKNLLGLAPGYHKSLYHRTAVMTGNMGDMLVDIYGLVKPKLAIMDGIVGMEGQGPLEGQPRNIGVVVAGRDSIALDAVCSSIINIDPMEVPTTKAATERGLGKGNLKDIEVIGTQIDEVKVADFKRPPKRKDI
ncbi:MAG TPA: hypothetical protein DET40_08615 [Lentisphaeria bacterium]|nr:MAG: hypothetical protein A2X45_12215 [Lentisphaerae bacterium GWF2_50_93]HCE43597.1 hypothetical protein [Lentisphaeria bacterium]